MNSPRSALGATYLDGFIYAFFGMTHIGTLLNSVERIETTTFKKWQLMQTNNEILISRFCLCAIPLDNNEILTFGDNLQGLFHESFLVDKNTTTLSKGSVPELQGYRIIQAVCISDNKVVAEVTSSSNYEGKFISFTRGAIPAVREL